MLVRITDAWQEILQRRAQAGGYPAAVTELLGEMTAAATLMQANIKFDGALVMQIHGDGPVKLAVAEVQPDLRLRATASVTGQVAEDAPLSHMVNVTNQGRCAITLDPKDRHPGQQPYQGVVPLYGDRHEKLERLSDVLQHYMLQSEQLDTRLILAADDRIAAGLLIQRLPARDDDEDAAHWQHLQSLFGTLSPAELAATPTEDLMLKLFPGEDIRVFQPRPVQLVCRCSHASISTMLVSLGRKELESLVLERGEVEVTCEFCGKSYRYSMVEMQKLFEATEARAGAATRH